MACLIVLACLGQTPKADTSIQSDLEHSLKNHVLSLRHPIITHGEMEFDATGNPTESARRPWLVYGAIYVSGVDLSSDALRLEGPRVALYDNKKESKPTPVALGETVRIKIQLDQPLSSMNDAQALLNRVFFLGPDNLEHARPEYRRGDAIIQEPLYHIGPDNGVKAPVALATPEPEFTETARRKRLQGTVVLSILISKAGLVDRIRILKPLGMGLDEQAVNAVKMWRFKPASKENAPVALEMNIEVSFNLYNGR